MMKVEVCASTPAPSSAASTTEPSTVRPGVGTRLSAEAEAGGLAGVGVGEVAWVRAVSTTHQRQNASNDTCTTPSTTQLNANRQT